MKEKTEILEIHGTMKNAKQSQKQSIDNSILLNVGQRVQYVDDDYGIGEILRVAGKPNKFCNNYYYHVYWLYSKTVGLLKRDELILCI